MNNKKIGIIFLLILFNLVFTSNVNAFELTATSETTKNVCPSNTILFTSLVSGTGIFTVSYDGSAAAFATVVPQGFSLFNGQRTIFVYVTPRLTTPPGQYNLNLIVTSGERKTLTYNINVQNCNQVTITGTSQEEFCACNAETFTYTIVNAGNYEETYSASVTGIGSQYVTLSEQQFTLRSGQSKKLLAYYNAPCGTAGDYAFNVNIRSLTSNAVASFSSRARVNSCYDFNLVPEKTFIDMCEHTLQENLIKIQNTADAENEFALLLTGPAWANLERNSLTLRARSSEDIKLILNPDYAVEGSFDVNLKVKSKEGRVTKDQVIKVNVRKCNDVVVNLERNEDNVCNIASKNYNVKIKNIGEFEKEFKLETNYPWVTPKPSTVTLKAGEEQTVNLSVNPTKNLVGIFDVIVKATASDTSKVTSEDSIKLNLVQSDLCFNPLINAENIVLQPDTTATIEVQVTNNGPEKAIYLLSLSGKATSFVQLNPATLEVEPSKTEVTYLYVAPPFNTPFGIYDAVITARVEGSDILETKRLEIAVSETGGVGRPREAALSLWQRFLAWIKKNLAVQQPAKEGIPTINKTVNETIVIEETPGKIPTEEVSVLTTITQDTKFRFKNQYHEIKIIEISNSSVTLQITSNPQYFILELNETEKVDVDQDGIYDYELTLKEIKNGKPVIESKSISEEVPLEEMKRGKQDLRKYSLLLLSFLIQYKFYIILGIIILIVLILIISYWKEIIDFFEEE